MSSGLVDLHMERTLTNELSANSWQTVPPGSAKLQVEKKRSRTHKIKYLIKMSMLCNITVT